MIHRSQPSGSTPKDEQDPRTGKQFEIWRGIPRLRKKPTMHCEKKARHDPNEGGQRVHGTCHQQMARFDKEVTEVPRWCQHEKKSLVEAHH